MYPIGSIIQRPLKEKGIKKPLSLFYKHVGIYVGNDKVIHFFPKDSSESQNKATIIKTSLKEFEEGEEFQKGEEKKGDKKVKATIRADIQNADHGRAICEKAERICSNPKGYDKEYDKVFNNCEDFAKACYEVEYNNGQKHAYPKTQVMKTLETAGELAIAGVGVGLVILKSLDKGSNDKKNQRA